MKRCKVTVLILVLLTALIPFGTPSAHAETDPAQNHVLQVLTGGPQWEGAIIHSDGSNSMNLEAKKTYEFAFRAYTPNKDVGLRFQANTFGGWDWDGIIDYLPEDLQPEGWYDISGTLTLDRPGSTDLPRLVLVKTQGDNEGLVAKLWIDDFTVTDTATGEVVFSEDFESGETGAFRDNGGVCSVVLEQAIYDDAVAVSGGEHALDVPSLKEIYQNYFMIGNIANASDFGAGGASQERYDIYKHHYNAITYENDMKPDSMWGPSTAYEKPEQRDFTALDEQIGRMTGDGFNVIGHTLGWHGQTPNWLNISAGNRNDNTAVYKPYAEARGNLEDYINLVAGRFYDRSDGVKIYSWDVLNEALRRDREYPADEENWGRHAIGHIWPANWVSPWYISYGTDAPEGVNPWDYIYDIYTFARKADPSAVLYYNDYGMEDPSQVQLVVNMVNVLNAQWAADTANNPDAGSYAGENIEIVREYKRAGGRLLIEGIGMQEHDTINTNIQNVETAIHAYAVTGCKVSITELDVGVPGYSRGQELSAEDEETQARYYAELFAMFKKNYEYIERVTFWGLDDAHSWRPNEMGLLFNGDLRTKEAYYAVADPEGWLAENSLEQPSEPASEETPAEVTPAEESSTDNESADPEVTPTPPAEAPEASPQVPAEPDSESSNHTLLIILIVIAAAAAVTVVFLVLRKKKTGKK
ncbi:MAG: endo-1,4-beta-xylanase [Oscillospiraceae bacterium]|nr:endo-1,4-beta-xylanase [Oscillospiraceae bacterium]